MASAALLGVPSRRLGGGYFVAFSRAQSGSPVMPLCLELWGCDFPLEIQIVFGKDNQLSRHVVVGQILQ